MNNLSYDVSSKKFQDQGFVFSQNLEKGIFTIELFKSINKNGIE